MKTTIIILMLASVLAYGGTNLTISANGSGPYYGNYSVPTGHIAQVSYVYLGGNSTMSISTGDANLAFVSSEIKAMPVVVGPAYIGLSVPPNTSWSAFCTIHTTDPEEKTFTPSTAVVIPADSNGPVTIILESSTDLVNWSPTLPGTYGTTAAKRFFRVRAER